MLPFPQKRSLRLSQPPDSPAQPVQRAPVAPSVALANPANSVVAVAVVLGLGGVETPATAILSTHGWKAFGRAKVS